MTKRADPPMAKATRSVPHKGGKRRGSNIAYMMEIFATICIGILVLVFAARGNGWQNIAIDTSVIGMIIDDGAIMRAVMLIAVFVGVWFAVGGRPAGKTPGITHANRFTAMLVFACFVALFAWFGFGWRP